MLRVITFCFLFQVYATAFGARVAVIRDADALIYSKVVLGIGVELAQEFSEYSLQGDASRGQDAVKSAIANGSQLIIAIGPKSANAAIKETKIPVIYCLVPRVEDYDLDRENAVGIRLEVPLVRQLGVFKSLHPNLSRVAVVADRDMSSGVIKRIKSDAKVFDLQIHVAHAKIATAVGGALSTLIENVDGILLISDPVALNITSFEAMVEFANKKKIPFMALDDGFVARGALFSFAIDYGLTGRQAASIANRVLNESMSLKDIRIIEHEGLNLAVNIKVAETLFKDGPFYKKLLQVAAEQRYGLEVF